jgi:D-alanine-D-alanine ligase
MKNEKTPVGILFGGQSAEHEISIKSTQAIYANIDRERFTPVLFYINKKGLWNNISEEDFNEKKFPEKTGFSFLPWLESSITKLEPEIYFPMLHGPNGEDGKIQSLLELAGKPLVGANSLSSSLAMDKAISKALFQKAGLNVGDFLVFRSNNHAKILETIKDHMSFPIFVKPCAMGSSVGISKIHSEEKLENALNLAFQFDTKIIIEKALYAREIEVSVMGNDNIKVSRPGELVPFNEFYDYNDKYIDGKTTFFIPANLDKAIEEEIREIALTAYKTLFLNGMSRVDLFLEKDTNKIYINELNTIPGFTEISMFPKLWTLEGISFKELITKLINYGFEYYKSKDIATT